MSHTSARCCGVYTCPAASARSTAYAPGWHAHARVGYTYNGAFGWESFLGCACCMLHRACCIVHVACCIVHGACCMLHVASCMLHRAWCMLHVACCIVHGSWSGVGRSAAPAQGSDLQAKMRHVVGERGEASAKGQRGRLDVLAKYQHTKVVPLSMHMPAALPIGIPPALVIARARSIQRGARGQSALSYLNSAVGVKGGEGGAGSNPEGGQTGKEGAQYNPFHSEAGRAMSFGRRLSESEDPDDRPRSHELTSRVARRGEAHRLRPQGSAR